MFYVVGMTLIHRFGVENCRKSGSFLRDGIASGRGVHRFWGCPIQKSRSNFGVKSGKSRIFGFLGVGVV